MKKYATRLFDLSKIAKSTKVVTRDGRQAVKITYLPELDHGRITDKCVSAVVLDIEDGHHNALKLYTKNGIYSFEDGGKVPKNGPYDLLITEEYEDLNGYVLVVLNMVTGKKEFAKISSTKRYKRGEYIGNNLNKFVIGYIPVTLSTENIERD